MRVIDLLLHHCKGILSQSDERGIRHLKVVPAIIIVLPGHLCLDGFLFVIFGILDLPEESVFVNLVGQKFIEVLNVGRQPLDFHNVASTFQKLLHFDFEIILIKVLIQEIVLQAKVHIHFVVGKDLVEGGDKF